MSTNVGSATGYLDLDISGFLAGLQSAQSAAGAASRNIVTKFGDDIQKAGKSLTSAGTSLTKFVTVPLLGVGAAGLKTAMNFEKGMSEVRAISGATGKDFDALKDKAIDLGATTAFSAGEVASAMTEMAKAGWGSQQIIDGMGGVLDAAAASGEGLASVATIVADAITGFGMVASDSTRVADLLTQAANSGTIGITDLGETFKYIAPVAGAMGLSIEDVTTAVAAMSMAGIKGSAAGTSLRGMLTRLVKPTKEVKAVMKQLGISVVEQDGSMKSLDDIVSNLRESFDGLTDSEKAKYAATLAGQEGMSGMLSLLNLTEEEYNAIAESMDNAGGIAQETATIMQDNLQSKVEQLGGSLESLAIRLGDLVIPYVQQFVEWLTSLVDKLTALDPGTQKTILKFAALAVVIGPLLVVLGTLISSVGTIISTFGKIPGAITTVTSGFASLKGALFGIKPGIILTETGITTVTGKVGLLSKAFAALTGPIGIAIAVIATLGAAFVSLWKNNEEFRENIIAIWNQIKETFNEFVQGIASRLNSLGSDFESIIEDLKVAWQAFCDFLAPIFEGTFQMIADLLKAAFDIILGIFDFWIAVFKGDWEGAWKAIESILVSILTFIENFFKNSLNTMKGILDVVCKWFGTTWSQTWTNIKTFFSNTWNNIKTNASNAVDSVKTTMSNGLTSAKNTVTSIFDSIRNKISSTLENAKTTVKNGIDKVKSFFNFSWSLPKLKMPHFTISGSFSLNPPSVPRFSIEWYKKAMSGGMIMNSPTIFGFDPTTGKFLGGGEAGSETIVGTESLMKMIRNAVVSVIGPMVEATYQLTKASHELGYITNNAFARQTQVFEQIMRSRSGEPGSGDTFIFNSPKAIDEVEAARQMKNAKRELAEGF